MLFGRCGLKRYDAVYEVEGEGGRAGRAGRRGGGGIGGETCSDVGSLDAGRFRVEDVGSLDAGRFRLEDDGAFGSSPAAENAIIGTKNVKLTDVVPPSP